MYSSKFSLGVGVCSGFCDIFVLFADGPLHVLCGFSVKSGSQELVSSVIHDELALLPLPAAMWRVLVILGLALIPGLLNGIFISSPKILLLDSGREG